MTSVTSPSGQNKVNKIAQTRRRSKLFRATALASSLIFLSACTLVNPYVSISTAERSMVMGGINTQHPGVAFAQEMRYRYQGKMGADAKLRNSLALSLIPIGATALGLAIGGESGTPITVLGLTGSSLYAGGQVLSSQPRVAIYAAGTKAISCAIDASLPFYLDDGTLALIAEDKLSDLAGKIGDVQAILSSVQLSLASLDASTPYAQNVKQYTVGVQQLIANATLSIKKANQLRTFSEGVDERLVTAVDKINDSVNAAVSKTVITLEGAAAVLSKLLPNAKLIAPGFKDLPKANPLTGEGDDEEDGITGFDSAQLEAVEDLFSAVGALTSEYVLLNGALTPVTSEDMKNALAGCGLEIPEGTLDLSLDPAEELSYEEGTDGHGGFEIEGGSGPFTVTMLEGTVKGISFNPIGRVVQILVTKEAPVGKYHIVVRDIAGQKAKRIITITKKAEKKKDGNEDGTASLNDSPHTENAALASGSTLCTADIDKTLALYGDDEKSRLNTPKERAKVQKALVVEKIDGDIGANTRAAICVFQETLSADGAGIAVTGYLDNDQIVDLLSYADESKADGALNYFEATGLPNDNHGDLEATLTALRAKFSLADNVGLDPDPSSDLRTAIINFDASGHNLPPYTAKLKAKGQLTPALLEAVLQ